ncbi:UDP-glycosyltransferase UGT5-like [Galleria mellonella]|uniref:UDP-glucuronosyltransferase n=1 Tax=Galleria mellonella TaxID=7137 RepID=A0ABM3MY96_GALME|nr:UDP-glycosyltransferase UGT5-like [Galleria mellonella]
MDRWLCLFLAVAAFSNICDAYRILVVFPSPGKSHNILGVNVVKHLLKAGHEVTYITPFPVKNPHPKLQQLDVSDNFDLLDEKTLDVKTLLNKEISFDSPITMFEITNDFFAKTIQNPNVVKVFNDTSQKFDVVIAEWMYNDAYSGIATLFDCPFIWFSTIEPHSIILSLIDESTNPAYVPDSLSSNIPPFNFKERVSGLFFQLLSSAFKTFYWNGVAEREFERLLGPYLIQRGKAIPSFSDVNYNVSLVLGNSHVSLGQAIRLPQNYIPVGGYHIDSDVKPLPEDLKKILDNAKNGLIYFSMGSNLKSKDLPDELKRGFLNIFSNLKQTVLWKFEEAIPNLPKNVHIVQWAPQPSILAHPNCVLFITHGGLLSTTETVHFGKPIIGIPVFGDQFTNMERAVKKGFAIKVTLSYTMLDEFKAAIDEAISNPKYRNKAKELSAIYHDRPVSPGKELVHWVEHVVRTRGAPHLRSPALHVPFYQKFYLDLLGIIVAILSVIVIVSKRVLKLKCKKKENLKKKKN